VNCRGHTTGRLVAAVAIAAMTALVAACSPGADFPSVLDKPTARIEQPMSPAEVQQATSALISDRNQLNVDAQAAQAGAAASGMSAPATTGTTPSAGAAAKP
jgi:hypothetical protein